MRPEKSAQHFSNSSPVSQNTYTMHSKSILITSMSILHMGGGGAGGGYTYSWLKYFGEAPILPRIWSYDFYSTKTSSFDACESILGSLYSFQSAPRWGEGNCGQQVLNFEHWTLCRMGTKEMQLQYLNVTLFLVNVNPNWHYVASLDSTLTNYQVS
jgi:hypothetical protein